MLLANRMVSVTVTRGAPGQYVLGTWTPAATTDLTIKAHVQPASARELLILPEGERTKGAVRFYTTDPLQTASEYTQTPADVVAFDGQLWQVQRVDPWPVGGGLQHYRSFAVKVEPAPTPTS